MRGPDQVVANHEAAAIAAKKSAATLAGTPGDDDAMNAHLVGMGQVQGKWVLASRIKEDAIGVIANPALSAKDLSRRSRDRAFEPASPVSNLVAGVGIGKRLVRENYDVAAEYDQDVAQFLTTPLVPVEVGVTPQAEKGPLTQAGEVFLCRRDAAGFLQLCNLRRIERIA